MGNCGISNRRGNEYALNTITTSMRNDDAINNGIPIVAHKMENSSAHLDIPQPRIKMRPSQLVQAKYQNIETDYIFETTLGKGAYGKVKKAKHRILNVIRAIKCIEKTKMNSEENKKLINEVEILKELDHPHIIKVYESYNNEKFFYIVTEYLEGGELFERITRAGCVSEEDSAEIMRQILSAVNYCHDRNIVHRDLKPENIMYERRSKNSPLKIIDFGTGRVLPKDYKLTSTFGTIYYIAPEVFKNLYDEKCDIWSCGVILYILMSGNPPFVGHDDEEIKEKILIGDYDIHEGDWKYISNGPKRLIRHMLEYNPEKRLSSYACLNSEWIISNTNLNKQIEKKPQNIVNILTNLRNFSVLHYKKSLQKAIWIYIVNYLSTADERNLLQRVFEMFDSDCDGKITSNELKRIYKEKLNEDITDQELQNIIKNVDIDQSGSIDYSEFIMATINRKRLLDRENLENTFKLFDKDSNGFITIQELKVAFNELELGDSAWNSIVEEVDKNGDGQICLEEFFQLFNKHLPNKL